MINLFELRYIKDQPKSLDEGFIFYDYSENNTPDLRELPALLAFGNDVKGLKDGIFGLFSPKFTSKTGLVSNDVVIYVLNNPDHDIYLFHPYPYETLLAETFLDLAELEHPGIMRELQSLWYHIYACDLPTVRIKSDVNLCCHCNFFLANRRFWSEYAEFIKKYYEYLYSNHAHQLWEKTTYNLSQDGERELMMTVFAFERCLTLFLKQREKEFSVANMAFSPEFEPVEIFPGERNIFMHLMTLVKRCEANRLSEEMVRRHCISAYYHYRILSIGARNEPNNI